jgi:hypothetical protein
MQSAETEVPLYNCNNEFMLMIPLAEAQELAVKEDCELKTKGLGRKLRVTAAQLRRRQPSIPSPCTLTKSDMLNNAIGVVTPKERKFGRDADGSRMQMLVGNCIDRAMTKVEAWPLVHDDRNTVICAGKAFGVIHQEAVPESYLNFA